MVWVVAAVGFGNGVARWLWEVYQASPPLMLAILTAVTFYGYRRLAGTVEGIKGDISDVKQTNREQVRRLDKHELLIDHVETKTDDVVEAVEKNDDRLTKIEAERQVKGVDKDENGNNG